MSICLSFNSDILYHPTEELGVPEYTVMSNKECIILQDGGQGQETKEEIDKSDCESVTQSPTTKVKRSLRLKTRPRK